MGDDVVEKARLTEKFILDACCGGKEMWTNKNHPNTLYIDIRKEEKGCLPTQPNFCIQPDIIADFRALPPEIKAKKFKLIAWDIPHFKTLGKTSIYRMKYGALEKETWQEDIKKGFKELWTILDDFGIILLKFNDYEIKFPQLLACIPETPLFYNVSTNRLNGNTTKWFCFMKIPERIEVRK